MTNIIQPGIPISQQMQQPAQPAVTKSPFEPSDIELDIMSGKFDRSAYDMARDIVAQQQMPRSPQQYQQEQVYQQPRQQAEVKNEISSEFLSNIEKRLADIRQQVQRPQYVQPAPQVQQTPPVSQPPQPVQQQQQEQVVKKEDTADDEWLKSLMNGTSAQAQQSATQEQQQQQTAPKESYFNLQKEEAERLTNYLDANQRYYNAIEIEAQRRGINPMQIAQALSQKPITEVVDFALGKYNNPVQQVQPAYNPPAQPQYQQPPVRQQYQQPAQQTIDPVDLGRMFNQPSQPQQEEVVYGGEKNWAF